jgi:hypothetical protein
VELGLVHAVQPLARNLAGAAGIENAGDAAHVFACPCPVEFSGRSTAPQRRRSSVWSYTAA